MKILALLTVCAFAVCLGACAQKETSSSTMTTSATTTGYAK